MVSQPQQWLHPRMKVVEQTGAAKIRSLPSYVRLRCSSETNFPVANECSSGRGGRWPKKDQSNGWGWNQKGQQGRRSGPKKKVGVQGRKQDLEGLSRSPQKRVSGPTRSRAGRPSKVSNALKKEITTSWQRKDRTERRISGESDDRSGLCSSFSFSTGIHQQNFPSIWIVVACQNFLANFSSSYW